ncbi:MULTISPECIES: transcriptional regulator GcvA [Ensifer]|uniref:Transcriptional regulator GcvA n=1 Tax=Ensifer adhaerens TaxID=106592 RepID=A0ABY8HFB0_ENSAD|nr:MULTISPECIES: transcriptional regulator GcvA [Ensifer]ANK71151.1 transcriptional regulator [Ensifer adhaerens]KDP73945.1 transcriptional regulator [Ensifer adhaerens]KQX23847.1 transcriptional regulator [Ensifer sp. Root423]KQZ51420.1 transcriptional regulator [Ensifer sp. Root558]MBD9538862.1 transcriptional regulator GcvA [Ensifer sp. ENS04]
MSTYLPSLASLRAFEATARHLSVTKAAQELNVTPGAVSLQVRELEQALAVTLFERRPRQLALTEDGSTYFATLRRAFRMMREATEELTARKRAPVLTVSCTPTFAAQWLVPRIGAFELQVPGIDVRISTTNRLTDFNSDGVDIAIRHGLGRYDGLVSERLIDDDPVPVLHPALRARNPLDMPGDLAAHVLLHDVHRQDWRLWLDAAGADGVDAGRGPVFVNSNGAIEAAKAGDGVALVRLSLVTRELAEGVLEAPFPEGVMTGLAYHLVYPPAALDRPPVTAFRAWIIEQARAEQGVGNAVTKRPPRPALKAVR